MKLRKLRTTSKGFTIVELIIATTVFSLVLLLASYGIIQIGSAFTRSVNKAKTQEVTRAILDDITQAIQFNGEDVTPAININNGSEGFCIGNRRYSYLLDRQLNSTGHDAQPGQVRHSFVVDSTSCNDSTYAQDLLGASMAGTPVPGIELMGERMAIDYFSIDPVASQPGFWNIELRVVYGTEEDLIDLDAVRQQCETGTESSRFCATSELKTTVKKRIR